MLSGPLWSFSARALLLSIRLISCSTTSVGEGSFLMSGYFRASFLMRGSSRSAKVCFWFFIYSSLCSYTACSAPGTLRSKEGCFEELAPLRSSTTERGILFMAERTKSRKSVRNGEKKAAAQVMLQLQSKRIGLIKRKIKLKHTLLS